MMKITYALLLLSGNPTHACTNLLITKGASADGSCMVTYAADSHTRYGCLAFYPAALYPKGTMMDVREWGTNRYFGKIPQAGETYLVVGNKRAPGRDRGKHLGRTRFSQRSQE